MLRIITYFFCFILTSEAFAQLYPNSCVTDSVYGKNDVLEYIFVDCDSISYEYKFFEGKLVSSTADYYKKIVHVKSNGHVNSYSNYNFSFFRSYYPNGVVKEEYHKKYISTGWLLIKWRTDTILEFHDTGIMKKQTVFGSNKTSQTTFYAENGRLKTIWTVDAKGMCSVKNYGPDGVLLPNGNFNAKGTGFLNHYTDEGSIDGMCYYRRGKLIPKKCIELR